MADNDSDSEKHEMTEEEIFASVTDKVLEALKVFDTEGQHPGQIRTDQLKDFLEFCSFKMDEQMIFKIASDLDPTQSGLLDGVALKNMIIQQEIEKQLGQDDNELLDAYVAMGGEPDGGGCVDANMLIKTIKEDFEMTIDIEKLIEEIDEDGSGEIEFDEFKALLTAAEGAAS